MYHIYTLQLTRTPVHLDSYLSLDNSKNLYADKHKTDSETEHTAPSENQKPNLNDSRAKRLVQRTSLQPT